MFTVEMNTFFVPDLLLCIGEYVIEFRFRAGDFFFSEE